MFQSQTISYIDFIDPPLLKPTEEETKITQTSLEAQNRQKLFLDAMFKKNKLKQERKKNVKVKKEKSDDEEIKNGTTRSGHWNAQENKQYHWFLQIYNSHFMNKHLRRMDKIFKTMANFIGSRQAEQCRSHHQKMEKKYHTFRKILLNLRNKNYGSYQTVELQKDLQAQGITVSGGILSQCVLHQEETIQNVNNHTQNEPTQDKFHSKLNFLQEDVDNNLIENIFADQNYENNLNFFQI